MAWLSFGFAILPLLLTIGTGVPTNIIPNVIYSNTRNATVLDISPNVIYFNVKSTVGGSIYLSNRDTVLSYLVKETPPLGSKSYSSGNAPDEVWGLAQCFNMSENCSSCLQKVRDELLHVAPLAVGGQFWLNKTIDCCYLRYENYKFSSEPPVIAQPPQDSPAIAPQNSAPTPKENSHSNKTRKILVGLLVGVVAVSIAIFCLFFLKEGIHHRFLLYAELKRSHEGPLVLTLNELTLATKNFSDENKLGEGGFGAVYKAVIKDGTQVAVKKLSIQSQQGKQEFLNEIHIVTNIQHRNLVRLKGYCLEGNQKLLVYEYLENGSLDHALFRPGVNLDWAARFNIAVGVARGLAYLHEDSQMLIIHRDIKASNILLDKNLNPKISDFGISKLFDLEKGHTSTTIAGTFGYLAPEYALAGRLTTKVDAYSFGVLLLEIISGRKCKDFNLPTDEQLLLQWTWSLKQSGRLLEVVDERLRTSSENLDLEALFLRVIGVALVCTNEDEELRPVMSDVVAMLLGYLEVPTCQAEVPAYLAGPIPLKILEDSMQESITKLEAR